MTKVNSFKTSNQREQECHAIQRQVFIDVKHVIK